MECNEVSSRELYRALGDRIRNARGKMTQADLAEKLDITRATVSNIETGKHSISLSTLYSLSSELGVEPKYLLPSVSEVIESKFDVSDRTQLDPAQEIWATSLIQKAG
jgi:transcriptional regulator with XRE-family HTH domain